MRAIQETHGEFEAGEIIYDGILVRRAAGGSPQDWDLSAICANASARASELFGIQVKFKAKPLNTDGDIFPEGQNGFSTALLDKGCIWYAPNGMKHAPAALGRAVLHAGKRGRRFVLALQSGLGVRFAAVADWDALRMRLEQGRREETAAWEVAIAGRPVRPWVCFDGDEEGVPIFKEALLRAISDRYGSKVAARASCIATEEGHSGRFALVVKGVPLRNCEAALQLNRLAFCDPTLAAKVLWKDRLLMPGQAPLDRPGDKRRLLTPGACWEDACFTEPGETVALAALGAESQDEHADTPLGDWSEEMCGALAIPEVFDEGQVCALVMRHVPPGDVHRFYHDRRAARALAKALWATCYNGDEEGVRRAFMEWATEGGYSMNNTPDEVDTVWEEATSENGQNSGSGDSVLVREMLDVMRDRAPEYHAAFVACTARSLTEGPARGAAVPPFVTLEFKEVVPGQNSIGSRAGLLDQFKYIADAGPPGLGKTEGHLATLRATRPESVLSVTTRRAVAHSMNVRYNDENAPMTFESYNEFSVEERRDIDFLICELESIGSLGRTYETVILDEFMAILMQTVSDINKRRYQRICAALKQLCKMAKHVFIADALLTVDAVVKFVDIVEGASRPEKVLYTVFTPATPPGRKVIMRSKQGKFTKEDIRAAFEERFEAGETRLFVFTNMKKLIPTIVDVFTDSWHCHHSGVAGQSRAPRIKSIDASTPQPSAGVTTDTWWGACDLVIVSPAITNSVSFNLQDHFHSVIAFCTNMSCIPPDVLQGCGRVRHPVSKAVHVYTTAGFSGQASAVKSFVDLQREAGQRDHRATPMERLCYSLASRARLFSLNFFPDYLEACFKAIGFGVTRTESSVSGSTPLAEAEQALLLPFYEVRRVKVADFLKIKDMVATSDGRNARDTLERIVGAPLPEGAEEETDAEAEGRAREQLRLISERFKFAVNLLSIESGEGPEKDMVLDAKQRAAVQSLWQAFNTESGRSKLWKARHAFLYELYSPGPGKEGMPDKLKKMFENSVLLPWTGKFRVLRKALDAVGLGTAVPIAGAACTVERAKLDAAYDTLASLKHEFDTHFGQDLGVTEEPTVQKALEMLQKIVQAWNPRVTVKQPEGGRKRKRVNGAVQEQGGFALAFIKDSNSKGEMELLHSLNLE